MVSVTSDMRCSSMVSYCYNVSDVRCSSVVSVTVTMLVM